MEDGRWKMEDGVTFYWFRCREGGMRDDRED